MWIHEFNIQLVLFLFSLKNYLNILVVHVSRWLLPNLIWNVSYLNFCRILVMVIEFEVDFCFLHFKISIYFGYLCLIAIFHIIDIFYVVCLSNFWLLSLKIFISILLYMQFSLYFSCLGFTGIFWSGNLCIFNKPRIFNHYLFKVFSLLSFPFNFRMLIICMV